MLLLLYCQCSIMLGEKPCWHPCCQPSSGGHACMGAAVLPCRSAPRARAGRENKSEHTGGGAEGENEPARHLAKGRARGTAPSAPLSSAPVTLLPPKAEKSTRKGPRRPFLPLPILLSSPSAAALSPPIPPYLLPSLRLSLSTLLLLQKSPFLVRAPVEAWRIVPPIRAVGRGASVRRGGGPVSSAPLLSFPPVVVDWVWSFRWFLASLRSFVRWIRGSSCCCRQLTGCLGGIAGVAGGCLLGLDDPSVRFRVLLVSVRASSSLFHVLFRGLLTF